VLREKAAIKEAGSYHSVQIPEVIMDMPSPEKPEPDAPSAEAREVQVIDAEVGMVIDRDIITDDGHLLMSKDTVLTSSHVNRLCDLSEILKLHLMWVRDS